MGNSAVVTVCGVGTAPPDMSRAVVDNGESAAVISSCFSFAMAHRVHFDASGWRGRLLSFHDDSFMMQRRETRMSWERGTVETGANLHRLHIVVCFVSCSRC